MKEGIFLGSVLSLLIFNGLFYLLNPTLAIMDMTGLVIGFIIIGVGVAAVIGIQFAGSGFSETSIKMMLVVGSIVNILFQIDIPMVESSTSPGWTIVSPFLAGLFRLISGQYSVDFKIGLGLLYPNVYNIFLASSSTNILGWMGFFVVVTLIIMTVVSGLLIALE